MEIPGFTPELFIFTPFNINILMTKCIANYPQCDPTLQESSLKFDLEGHFQGQMTLFTCLHH